MRLFVFLRIVPDRKPSTGQLSTIPDAQSATLIKNGAQMSETVGELVKRHRRTQAAAPAAKA